MPTVGRLPPYGSAVNLRIDRLQLIGRSKLLFANFDPIQNPDFGA